MLTKEERAAIAERLRSTYYITNSTLFKALTGEEELIENDQVRELCVIARVIFDLCDTSNMIELPLDKDGEVIHAGDTVYVGDREFTVNGFTFNDNGVTVRVVHTEPHALNFYKSNELTHKKTVTVASLVGEIRRTLSQNTIMNKEATSKLWEITDQIEMLGDSDD
jgi:hypothetical protein